MSLTNQCAISAGPAFMIARGPLQPVLGQGGVRAGRGRFARRARHVLVAAQLATALVLVTGTGLLLRSIARFEHVDLGFRPDHLLLTENRLLVAPPKGFAATRAFSG